MIKTWKRPMRWFLNFYRPFLGAGIRVRRLQADWKAIELERKLRVRTPIPSARIF
jgi:hypothetical protein